MFGLWTLLKKKGGGGCLLIDDLVSSKKQTPYLQQLPREKYYQYPQVN